jgi:hypothetical protein
MMPDTALSTDPADGGAPSEIGTVTAEYIAADLRPLAFPVAALNFDAGNARVHDAESVRAIQDSYVRHGQLKAVVAKRQYRGVRNAVLAGNGGLAAARALGWTHLAVVWLDDHLSDDNARDFAYRDNLTQEASRWDADQLRADADVGLDLLALGFDGASLVNLLGADAPTPRFEPEAPTHRLDELADNVTCPACGHSWHQERR